MSMLILAFKTKISRFAWCLYIETLWRHFTYFKINFYQTKFGILYICLMVCEPKHIGMECHRYVTANIYSTFGNGIFKYGNISCNSRHVILLLTHKRSCVVNWTLYFHMMYLLELKLVRSHFFKFKIIMYIT